jgi:hypothetical protein
MPRRRFRSGWLPLCVERGYRRSDHDDGRIRDGRCPLGRGEVTYRAPCDLLVWRCCPLDAGKRSIGRHAMIEKTAGDKRPVGHCHEQHNGLR